jgi:hypothetical protein
MMRTPTSLALALVLAACSSEPAAPDDGLLAELPESDGKADEASQGAPNEWGEIIRPDEAEVFKALTAKIKQLQDLKREENGGVKRGFHSKVHACVRGTLTLDDARPAFARHGIFGADAPADGYQVWLRLSNGQGVNKADSERDVRGWAMKVLGAGGQKLLADDPDAPEGDRTADTQDFNMTNRAASHVDDAVQFMNFAEAVAKGGLSFAGWIAKHPISFSRLLGQTRPVESLATTPYWTGSAYRLGPEVVKVKATPCPGVAAGTQGATREDPDYLRKDLTARMRTAGLCYDLEVQRRENAAEQPVEKASATWDEEKYPFVKVGRVTVPPIYLVSLEAAEDQAYCNDLSFNPWHGRVEHQPLGHMNRARKPVYQASADHRGRIPEPAGARASQ